MKAARTVGVLVCLLGLALTSAATQVEPSATGDSDPDSVSAQEILVEKGPETKGRNPVSPDLSVLLLVVYGSVISFLVARLVTYENYKKARSLSTQQNSPLLIPFILCPIVIYVVMEFWRVANTTTDTALTTGWFLYDIFALLFALLALQGFLAGMQEIPIDLSSLSPQRFQDFIQRFWVPIPFGCVCLAVLLGLAVVRFWSTPGIKGAGEAMIVDSIGAVMSLVAAYLLTRQKQKYFAVFVMTFIGFILAVSYLIRSLVSETG